MYKFITVKDSFFKDTLQIRTLTTIDYKKYVDFLNLQNNISIKQDLNWTFLEEKKDFEIIVSTFQGKIRGSILIYIIKIPFSNKTFLYSPNGIVIGKNENKEKVINDILIGLKVLAERENASLLYAEQNIKNSKEWTKIINKFNIHTIEEKENMYLHVSFKNKTLHDLFNSLDKSIQHTIISQKENLIIREGNIKDLQNFYKLLKSNNKCKKIKPFYYYYNMLTNANPLNENVKLYIAEYNNELISGVIVSSYNKQTECITMTEKETIDTNIIQEAMILLHWHILSQIWDNEIDTYIIKTPIKESELFQKLQMEKCNFINNWEIIFEPYSYLYYKLLKKINQI